MISLIFFLLFAPIGYGVAAEVPTPKPLVVVSMPPYLHMVKTLVGEQVDVISIVPPGADRRKGLVTSARKKSKGKMFMCSCG